MTKRLLIILSVFILVLCVGGVAYAAGSALTYDADGDNLIDRYEAQSGVRDYLDGDLSQAEAVDLFFTYFAQEPVSDTDPGRPLVLLPTATPVPGVPESWDSLDNVDRLERDEPERAETIKALPWVADGIHHPEDSAVLHLIDMALGHEDVFDAVAGKLWVVDGIDSSEATILQDVVTMAQNAGDATTVRMLSMPFMETIDPMDTAAFGSMAFMAQYDNALFIRVMTHPSLSGGINDDWAHVLATLNTVNWHTSQEVEDFLDTGQVNIEERYIKLPKAGFVQLAVIRSRTGVHESMDLLEHAVRQAELNTGIPFPTDYVSVLFADLVRYPAINLGTFISARPVFDQGNTDFASRLIAHEVAHYYAPGGDRWLIEGMADFVSALNESARKGELVSAYRPPCVEALSISALEELAPRYGEAGYECHYSLGESLFLALHATLGEEEFRQGLRELYAYRHEDTTSIERVRAAWLGEEAAAVITRWYDGEGED